MASSAFSFHCMICFEEFDPQTNYPVVLPCGHTYVCIECANRLDKCMECRTPLTMEVCMPPPPPPATPGQGIGATPRTPGPSSHAVGGNVSPDPQKQQESQYADRIRNSPGYMRRYGGQYQQQQQQQQQRTQQQGDDSYQSRYANKRGPQQPPPPPQPLPKQRLPLPKNAVLLSLIQASEPARRRAEVEAPPTPQKTDTTLLLTTRSETPSPGNRTNGGTTNTSSSISGSGLINASTSSIEGSNTFPKFSRPSPLFLDKSSSGEHDSNGLGSSGVAAGVGSQPDDEEHKIRVGTYLEGGPCGTYAVASKKGLLVYPTLFEHTLPSALKKMHKGEEEDEVKRDVEELVKKHRAVAGTKYPSSSKDGKKEKKGKKKSSKKNKEKEKEKTNKSPLEEGGGGSNEADCGMSVSPVHTELGAWVECHEDSDNAIEAQCTPSLTLSPKSSSNVSSPTGATIPMMDDEDSEGEISANFMALNDSDLVGNNIMNRSMDAASTSAMEAMSDPGGATTSDSENENDDPDVRLSVSLSECGENDDVRLSVSLTISDDEDDDDDIAGISASVRTLPARRSQSIMEMRGRHNAALPQCASKDDGSTNNTSDVSPFPMTKKFVRHFSQGTYPLKKKSGKQKGGDDKENQNGIVDEFDRPLIRLKYGDRVQVVSMDSRGWVKLARGYGYIRLESDKQLVKVGGTSDKACQIEAMLHELSIERNRLKHEQMKLEHLSAGLMIDLQSSLLTSDDNVVVPAPAGSLLRSDSEVNLSIRGASDKAASNVSLDDIDVSTRTRTVLTPPRSTNEQRTHPHREIRTAKSHSPGRHGAGGLVSSAATATTSAKAPPSPPYGQITPNLPANNWSSVNTPTRVNFRTGLSGHRALTSAQGHPHDFIGGGTIRSMSNHSGISSSKKASSRGRSIY